MDEEPPRQRSDSMETDKGYPQDKMLVNLDTHLKNEEAQEARPSDTDPVMKHNFESPSRIEVDY